MQELLNEVRKIRKLLEAQQHASSCTPSINDPVAGDARRWGAEENMVDSATPDQNKTAECICELQRNRSGALYIQISQDGFQGRP